MLLKGARGLFGWDRIRLAEGSPTSESQLPKVNGCNEICVMLISAVDASEERLASSIEFVYCATPGASLRGEVGFCQDHRNSQISALIRDHLLKPTHGQRLKRRPGASEIPL